MREVTHTLVLSDLHFGDTRCTLHSMATARVLATALRSFTPLKEIILLGDILDLQLANWAKAVEGAILPGGTVGFRYFINFLLQETGARSVIYVPGNHDYRVFDYHSIEKHLIRPLREGKKLSGQVAFFRTFPQSFLQGLLSVPEACIKVVYPHYSVKLNGARIILTHGHFFDPTQGFNHEVGKVFSRSDSLSKKELQKIRHDYFKRVSLYQNIVSGFSTRKELRELFNAIYHPFTAFKLSLRHKTRKSFLTPAMRCSIENYVSFCCRGRRVDGVIFGHTHHAGKTHVHDGPVRHIWNAGTFLRESSNTPLGSFITIRNDPGCETVEAIQIHTLE